MKNPFYPKRINSHANLNLIKLVKWSPIMKLISWLLVICILNLTGGCMNYFKVRKATGSVSENIDKFDNENKTIVVHLENKAWILTSPDLLKDQLVGTANNEYVPTLKNPIKPNGTNRYRTKKPYRESHVLNEVHIYASELTRSAGYKISIPLNAIQKIEVYEKDQANTIGSWVLGILGGTALAYTILMIIVLLTKSSCPFIYAFDGENYYLAGEIYSGSVQPQLERHDFLKLPDYDIKNEKYQLKIANEVKEVQHTNLMELWVFNHPDDMDIWVDKYGKYHTVSQLIAPSSAKNLTGVNIFEAVREKDSLYYSSTIQTGVMPITDGLVLEFPKPKTASVAKLVVRAKNTFTLDYMMGQFQNQFGDLYKAWNKKQQKAPAEKLRQWSLDQNIPLSLAVERNNVWETVDYFNISGPMAFKEDILSIPLNGNESDPLKVKLEFGNFFWEIDYAGIDYSTDTELNYQVIPVNSAVTQDGKDVSKQLQQDDKKYYIQPEVGDNAVVTFLLSEQTSDERTIYLHSKGWYQILRNPSGTPDREYLEAFRQPGRFNQFVNEYFQSLSNK